MTITVYGDPKPQPRPRFDGHHTYNPSTADAWKRSICIAALPYRPAEPWDGPLAVSIRFALKRPKAGKYAEPIGKPDLDNLAKAVLDALTDVGMWTDDSRVVSLDVSKCYADQPGAIITIERR